MSEPRPRILLVEDKTALFATLRDDLEESGFTVQPAITGEEALRKAAQDPPDIVLLDLLLPGQENAMAVLAKLKKSAETRGIPVIIVSDVGDEERMREALNLGADAYFLRTRYSLTDLLERIHPLLQQRTT